MITRNLLSCCMYRPSLNSSSTYPDGGYVINFTYNRMIPNTYGIRYDMNKDIGTTGNTNASEGTQLFLTKTGKALEDLTEREIYNPRTALLTWAPIPTSAKVKAIKAEGASVYTGLEYTFLITNQTSATYKDLDTIYVVSANTSSSSPTNDHLYVVSIHKLNEPITLAPLDVYQFKVSYDNLVIDVPSTIAST